MTRADKTDKDEIDDLVADFATRLDSLVAAWEHAIAEQRAGNRPESATPARSAADVFTELDHTFRNVELQWAEHQRAVRDKRAAADEWQERAMENVRQGRDDLAREALTRGQECSTAADVAAAEADALDAGRDAYRNALTAVRATVADRASA